MILRPCIPLAVYCVKLVVCDRRVANYCADVWYNNGRKRIFAESDFRFPDSIHIPPKRGLTTYLTIYGFGLRGNSVHKSPRKHRFSIRKHQKSPESPYFTRLYRFGTKKSLVRIQSLRPHENNPNILLLGEAFGLFVLFEYPNFNSKK